MNKEKVILAMIEDLDDYAEGYLHSEGDIANQQAIASEFYQLTTHFNVLLYRLYPEENGFIKTDIIEYIKGRNEHDWE